MIGNSEGSHGDPVTCENPERSHVIGVLNQIPGGQCLLNPGGGILVSHYKGVCVHCGSSVRFNIDDRDQNRALDRKIERIIRERIRTGYIIESDLGSADRQETQKPETWIVQGSLVGNQRFFSEPVKCPACQNKIGRLRSNGPHLVILDTGGSSLAEYFDGICQCGNPVHFRSGDWIFGLLVRSAIRVRNGIIIKAV